MKGTMDPKSKAETIEEQGASLSEAAVQARASTKRHFIEEKPPQKRPKNFSDEFTSRESRHFENRQKNMLMKDGKLISKGTEE